MAYLSKSAAKGLASISLILFFFSVAVFLILSCVDYSAPHTYKATDGTIQTELVFGTGTYWVVNLSVPFFFLLVFIISTVVEYFALKDASSLSKRDPAKKREKIDYEKSIAIYNWPLYRQDVWTFVVYTVALWAVLIGCYVGYQSFYGYNTAVTEDPEDSAGSEMTDKFQSNTLIAITIDMIVLWLAFDCIYAYTYEIYDSIEKYDKIEKKIIEIDGKDALRKPGQPNVF